MDLTGTQWNLQQQFVSQYSQEPANLQLSLGAEGVLSVTAAGQTYQGSWAQHTFGLVSINLTFAIGPTTFSYQGFVQAIQQQYGTGGSISVNGTVAGTWDALSVPAN